MQGVYVTRGSYGAYCQVWPAIVGVRKFHGCVVWGAAWKSTSYTHFLFKRSDSWRRAAIMSKSECRKRFGFYPRPGTAWWVSGKGRRSKVDIDFSD
jgi:hypothetical protein